MDLSFPSLISPGHYSENVVSVMREKDGVEDVFGYFAIMVASEKNVVDHHIQTAQRFLECGEMAEADRHIQKAVAIRNSYLTPLVDYAAAQSRTNLLIKEKAYPSPSGTAKS